MEWYNMAKFVITFENETIRKELIFNGETFAITMLPWDNGIRTSDTISLENQYKIKHGDDLDNCEEIMDLLYGLDMDDEDEIEEILQELSYYEKK
jgi:hypothetical protein